MIAAWRILRYQLVLDVSHRRREPRRFGAAIRTSRTLPIAIEGTGHVSNSANIRPHSGPFVNS
jgi:hypothetical protein